jgi:hypothetical protein
MYIYTCVVVHVAKAVQYVNSVTAGIVELAKVAPGQVAMLTGDRVAAL